jgi:hypothetical protein
VKNKDKDNDRTPILPYVKESETSRDAALSKEETYKIDEAKILALLKAVGEHGATDYEIETATRMRQSSTSARRGGLVQKGLVRDSGLKRKTFTGRYATVWILGTGQAVKGSGNERVPRPSPQKIKAALASIDRIFQHAETHHGPQPDVEVHEVLRWLSKLARQQDALDHKIVVREPKEESQPRAAKPATPPTAPEPVDPSLNGFPPIER